MSKCKFNVGDDAYYIMPASKTKRPISIIEVNPSRKLDDYKVFFKDTNTWDYAHESELEPISDHMIADELAELIASTPTERQDAEKLDKESEHIAKLMVETTAFHAGYDKGYERGHEDGYKDGYDAHCKEIAQAGIDAMHSEYKRGWRECRAKMMEFISKDYQDDLGRVDE